MDDKNFNLIDILKLIFPKRITITKLNAYAINIMGYLLKDENGFKVDGFRRFNIDFIWICMFD